MNDVPKILVQKITNRLLTILNRSSLRHIFVFSIDDDEISINEDTPAELSIVALPVEKDRGDESRFVASIDYWRYERDEDLSKVRIHLSTVFFNHPSKRYQIKQQIIKSFYSIGFKGGYGGDFLHINSKRLIKRYTNKGDVGILAGLI